MPTMKVCVTIVVLFTAICLPLNGYTQPSIPREAIPQTISDELRQNLENLYSPSTKQRVKAIRNIGAMGEDAFTAVPFLIALLTDFTPLEPGIKIPRVGAANFIRNEAIGALVEIGTPAVDQLISSLQEDNVGIKKLTAWALGEIGDGRAVGPLITAASDRNLKVRYRAVEALGKFNDPRVVEPLCKALGDRNPMVRKQAARILPAKNDLRAVQPLIAALKDINPDVRRWASNGLATLTGENFGMHPAEWQKWWSENKDSKTKKAPKQQK